MKVFQAFNSYLPYQDDFNRRHPALLHGTFSSRLEALLVDGFMGLHILKPALGKEPDVQFCVPNDPHLMGAWAKENGMSDHNNEQILLSMIEDSRADVFYSLHPKVFAGKFIKKLPGNIRTKIGWLAAPDDNVDFGAYDAMVSNFPPLLEKWSKEGKRAFEFFPAVDESISTFSRSFQNRDIDLSFAGQYSPSLHTRRNELIEVISRSLAGHELSLNLQCRKWKPILDKRFVRRINSPVRSLPKCLRGYAKPPVYGVGLYELFGRSRIVFNAAIDFSQDWRVNMRCFEVAASGACMISDAGRYPDGFIEEKMFVTYKDESELVDKAKELIANPGLAAQMGRNAQEMVFKNYNKDRQWQVFQTIASTL